MDVKTIKVGIDNCYLIKQEGTILVDGGMPGKFNEFTEGLKKSNTNPKEIKAIIITHCHWDHIGCAKAIKDATGAKVMVQKNESNILEQGLYAMPPGVTRWGKILGFFLSHWSKKNSLDKCAVDILLGENDRSLDDCGINGKIVFTPGHSPGSVSVILESGAAFVGDMAMNGLPLTMGPRLPIFAENCSSLNTSWRKLIDKGVRRIYPAHGKPFSIDRLINKGYDLS